VKATGRRKLILAAVLDEMCLAMPTIHALGEGYGPCISVTDASGGVSVESSRHGGSANVQAGAVPITGWPERRMATRLGRESTLRGYRQRSWAEHGGEVASRSPGDSTFGGFQAVTPYITAAPLR